jgi:hypothetical protein
LGSFRVTLVTLVTLVDESLTEQLGGGAEADGGFRDVARVLIGEAGDRVTLVTLVLESLSQASARAAPEGDTEAACASATLDRR